MPTLLEADATNRTYIEEPGKYFTVDGYSMRIHALMLPARIEAAREIYAAVPAIAEEASKRLMRYFQDRDADASHLKPDPCRRDLELTGQLIAGVVVGENFNVFQKHLLRHQVVGSLHGYEVPNGSAMLMMYAIQVSREVLNGEAQRLFEGYCWMSIDYLRHASAGAYVAQNAHQMATWAMDRMEASVSRLEEAYGASTRQKGIRDLSMLLAAMPTTLGALSRHEARANLLAWIFDHIAGEIPKYTDLVWMPVFRHLWEAVITHCPAVYAHTLEELFRDFGQTGRRFREGARLYQQAGEFARNAAYAAYGQDSTSTGDVSAAAPLADVYESVIKHIALHFTLGTPPNVCGLPRQWLQFHCNELPKPSPDEAVRLAETLHVSLRNQMRTRWNQQLDALLESISKGSNNFSDIVHVNERIPAIVRNVMKQANPSKLESPADTQRRLTIMTLKCFEIASRGNYADNSELLWRWHYFCLDGGNADDAQVTAALYQALPKAGQQAGLDRLSPHLLQFLNDFAEAAEHYPAARVLSGPQASEIAERALAKAGINDRHVPTSEVVFLLNQMAKCVLRGGSQASLAELFGWIGTHCTPHALPMTPINHMKSLVKSLHEATINAVPKHSQELVHGIFSALLEQTPRLMASTAIDEYAEVIARESIDAFAGSPEWAQFELKGKEEKSRRDLQLLMRAIAAMYRGAHHGTDEIVADWGLENVRGFLRQPTLKSVEAMLQHVDAAAHRHMDDDMAAVLMQALKTAYGVRKG